MIRRLVLNISGVGKQAVKHIHSNEHTGILLCDLPAQPYKYLCQDFRIITSSMMIEITQPEMLGNIVELVLFKLRKHYPAHRHSIY